MFDIKKLCVTTFDMDTKETGLQIHNAFLWKNFQVLYFFNK